MLKKILDKLKVVGSLFWNFWKRIFQKFKQGITWLGKKIRHDWHEFVLEMKYQKRRFINKLFHLLFNFLIQDHFNATHRIAYLLVSIWLVLEMNSFLELSQSIKFMMMLDNLKSEIFGISFTLLVIDNAVTKSNENKKEETRNLLKQEFKTLSFYYVELINFIISIGTLQQDSDFSNVNLNDSLIKLDPFTMSDFDTLINRANKPNSMLFEFFWSLELKQKPISSLEKDYEILLTLLNQIQALCELIFDKYDQFLTSREKNSLLAIQAIFVDGEIYLTNAEKERKDEFGWFYTIIVKNHLYCTHHIFELTYVNLSEIIGFDGTPLFSYFNNLPIFMEFEFNQYIQSLSPKLKNKYQGDFEKLKFIVFSNSAPFLIYPFDNPNYFVQKFIKIYRKRHEIQEFYDPPKRSEFQKILNKYS